MLMVMLGFVHLSLYSEGNELRRTVLEQTQLQASKELENAFKHSYAQLNQELSAISEWDEVFQQFYDSSYYFYWHDERLQESGYFKPYYIELELYNKDKTLLTPASPNNKLQDYLPNQLDSLESTIRSDNTQIKLTMFAPVNERGEGNLIGYVGIVVNLHEALLTQNHFNIVNQATIQVTATDEFEFNQIMDHVQFEPHSNPVSEYLWQLIQDFIIELILLMIMISALLSFVFNVTIYEPLNTISAYLAKLRSRPREVHTIPQKQFFLKEFEELKNTLHSYHHDLQLAQKKLDQQNRTVWEQARRDGLTNALNRRAFDEAWAEAIESYERYKTQTIFILFDCDFFKALNDTYGHEVGDEVIKLTASTLEKSLPMGIVAYRIGGDEFAVIIQECDTELGMKIVENTLTALDEAPFGSIGIKEKMTFSVGISSTLSDESNDIVNLPRQADIAMYKAKESVRNKVQLFHHISHSDTFALFSKQDVGTVIDAINTGQNIALHFQPIKAVSGPQIYYEALLRIKNKDQLIFPNNIFTIVDRRRLEVELDHQVIEQVKIALEKGIVPKGTGLAINISGKTLIQPAFPELCRKLVPFLEDYKIVLEITENTLIDHMDYTSVLLNELREIGFLIALDDFGSGYSSIRYLANMPVDIVKFDMTMTQSLFSGDLKTQKIIRSTAEMILLSGYDLVMEGVESEDMRQAAHEAGATHIQGYLLGRPEQTPLKF